jgi:4-amino-4-deoxy-L-arabinose transferase-like glycosyltransferase
VSAFFVRFENFKKPVPRTIDETVYFFMARQMGENIFEYNATNYALYFFLLEGRRFPKYFHDPLFKHPPLFVLMILSAFKIFGYTAFAANFFPLVLGVLSIALIYLLGRLVSGRMVGLLAASFMWIDPVAIMSSQKVWMDTPLMFFMLLTVYSYWMAVKEKKNMFFLIGGLAAGSAFMIKYPGILTFFGIIIFFLMTCPEIFKNRYFQWSLVFPILMSLPWAFWNYYVYGMGFIQQQLAAHSFISVFSFPVFLFLIILFSVACLFVVFFRNIGFIPKKSQTFFSSPPVYQLKCFCFLFMLAFSILHGWRSLSLSDLPSVSWQGGAFSGEPGWFYLRRLLEYSFLYAFAYLSFFDPFSKGSRDIFLIKINGFLIMIFFTAWGNFQCRYILPALPFLMILSADYLWNLFKKSVKIDFVFFRLFFQAALLLLIALALSKTMLVNQEISFTNNMCYF